MTEANLGDGIFRATDYLAQGGVFGIGSDSNIATFAAQELQQLEYSQRLRDMQRNVLAGAVQPHVAANLWSRAAQGGARAAGRPEQGIAVGGMASFVTLTSPEPAAMGPVADTAALDFHMFAGRGFTQVMSSCGGGTWFRADTTRKRRRSLPTMQPRWVACPNGWRPATATVAWEAEGEADAKGPRLSL